MCATENPAEFVRSKVPALMVGNVPRAHELTKVPSRMELHIKSSSCLWTANIFG
jgi:hypothetical protein